MAEQATICRLFWCYEKRMLSLYIMNSTLKIALFQCDVIWEQPHENRSRLKTRIDSFFHNEGAGTKLLVLPEFFTTGFSMNAESAELAEGAGTLEWMRSIAAEHSVAIAGSIPVKDGENIFNRHYFVFPDGRTEHYDKKHLFRMSQENDIFSAGNKRVIVEYLGWKIALNTCYDLRFPAWSRNSAKCNGADAEFQYDLMLNVASWPHPRITAAQTLVRARAIENLSYYAFVNRTGDSPADHYSGGSMIVDFKGCDTFIPCEDECFLSATLDLDALNRFRTKFPAWMDADDFEIR